MIAIMWQEEKCMMMMALLFLLYRFDDQSDYYTKDDCMSRLQ